MSVTSQFSSRPPVFCLSLVQDSFMESTHQVTLMHDYS